MSYYEQLCELARAKGIDIEKLTEDLVTVAQVMGGISVEDVAYSFLRAIEWKPE